MSASHLDLSPIKAYVLGNDFDENDLNSRLDDIIRIVVIRYFSSYKEDQDIWSMARLKALVLLNSDFCDVKKNLFSFLFTGIRNEVGNFINRKGIEKRANRDMAVIARTRQIVEPEQPRCEVVSNFVYQFEMINDRYRRLNHTLSSPESVVSFNIKEPTSCERAAIAGAAFRITDICREKETSFAAN